MIRGGKFVNADDFCVGRLAAESTTNFILFLVCFDFNSGIVIVENI